MHLEAVLSDGQRIRVTVKDDDQSRLAAICLNEIICDQTGVETPFDRHIKALEQRK